MLQSIGGKHWDEWSTSLIDFNERIE
jgi:hypothetical protein